MDHLKFRYIIKDFGNLTISVEIVVINGNEMKNDFSITWSFIKNIAGVSVNKLKNWYEVWRGV